MTRTCQARAGRWAAVLLGLLNLVAQAVEAPPLPAEIFLPDDVSYAVAADGELSWLGLCQLKVPTAAPPGSCAASTLGLIRWNPATGAVQQTPLEPVLTISDVVAQAALPGGQWLWMVPGRDDGGRHERIVFVPNGARRALTLELDKGQPFAIRRPAQWLALGLDAAALVARDEQRRLRVVTVRRQGDRLVLDELPASGLVVNGDYTAAVAGADQIMVLGGSSDKYRGCGDCRAEALVLDLKKRAWRAGPKMLEARSEAAATSLPDGSVLVSGGWTQAAPWGYGPSFTAERWNPASDRFEPLPPMPNGNARHRFQWWRAPWGNTLVSVMGLSGAAHAFDPATRSWREIGAWRSGSEEGGCGFFPFVLQGQAYAWQRLRSQGQYSTRQCDVPVALNPGLLWPPAPAVAPAPPESARVNYRSAGGFLPADAAAPALLIGGEQHAGMNDYPFSGAVEAIDRLGRLSAWPSLQVPRRDARAVRLAGGVLVWGGLGPDQAYRFKKPADLPLAEWLPPGGERPPGAWQAVGGDVPQAGEAITALPDGGLLAVSVGGELRQLRLEQRAGRPVLVASPWPAAGLPRRKGFNEGDELDLQALPDGRVVLSGGAVRDDKIALLTPGSLQPGTPDQYVPIGPYGAFRHNEVFDGKTRTWAVSKPSESYGGRVLMIADGRVVKKGVLAVDPGANAPLRYLREVFDPQTMAWTPLEMTASRLLDDDRHRLFTLQVELLAAGMLAVEGDAKGTSAVEWLNPAARRWQLLWQARDRYDDNRGRVILRAVAGTRGQSKILIIPVEGF